jgi:transcriptional regulator with XRE-family HTH domain
MEGAVSTAVREALDQRGISVNKLARRLGISHSHLSRQLSGERPIPVKQAIEMANITGLPPATFMAATDKAGAA